MADKPAPESEPDTIVEDAWRMLQSLLETGKATLKNGQKIDATHPLVGLIERTARLSKPQERRMGQVENFRVAKTNRPGAAA